VDQNVTLESDRGEGSSRGVRFLLVRVTRRAGQPQRERTAFAHDTLDGDIPAQELGVAAGDREAEARALS
jgi:hypothetical protein